VASIQATYNGLSEGDPLAAVAMTAYYLFISSYQLLIDATGSLEIIR